MRFYSRQPVVCIDDRWGRWWVQAWLRRMKITTPIKGARYTVRGYVDAPGPPCVLLMEISNPRVPYSDDVWREVSFADTRFAPITEEEVRGIIEKAQRAPDEALETIDEDFWQTQKEEVT